MGITISCVEQCWDENLGANVSAVIHDSPELNLTNRNFSTLWSALGLDPTHTGSVPVGALSCAVEGADAALIERTVGWFDAHFDSGITRPQAENYLQALREITEYASEKRNIKIEWY